MNRHSTKPEEENTRPAIDTKSDSENLTLEITTELDATPDRIWRLWADPRLLEKWWGPPICPATFVEHDLCVGGSASYFMTGPDGEKFHGMWQFLRIDPPHGLEIQDGFADDAGEADMNLPRTVFRVTIEAAEGAGSPTRMTIQTSFESSEDMEKLSEMGMVEGMTAAMGQIDDLL